MTKDKDLKRLIEEELEFQPNIDSADIGVTVENGVVTLTGHTPNYAQMLAAEQVVRGLKGVRAIAQDMKVRPYPGATDTDEEVAARCLTQIDWNVWTPKDTIQVRVKDGFVTLTGEVPWDYQRAAAVKAVRTLRGVTGVSNQIMLQPQAKPDDIKQRIRQALERQADLRADGITVTVEGGKVRLGGAVKAWRERDTAERAAWSAPGVKSVDDHIEITF